VRGRGSLLSVAWPSPGRPADANHPYPISRLATTPPCHAAVWPCAVYRILSAPARGQSQPGSYLPSLLARARSGLPSESRQNQSQIWAPVPTIGASPWGPPRTISLPAAKQKSPISPHRGQKGGKSGTD